MKIIKKRCIDTKDTLKIFSGRSNLPLAQGIVDVLGMDLGNVTIRTFADGELWVKYEENIRGQDVFIIQSTNEPADNLIELFLLLDAAVRASAKRVTAVIPYFGYGRQDRKDQPRVPISSRVMVDVITTTGANRIISMDLHSTQIQGFASIPFDHLYSRMVLMETLKNLDLNPDNCTVLMWIYFQHLLLTVLVFPVVLLKLMNVVNVEVMDILVLVMSVFWMMVGLVF